MHIKAYFKIVTCLLLIVILYGCKKDSSSGNGGCITTSVANPVINQSFTLTDCMNGAISAAWDFGDGTVGAGIITTKIYALAGTYTVKLISTTTGGQTVTVTKTIIVSTVPNATFTYGSCSSSASNGYLFPGDTVWFVSTFAASTYFWDFGDGATSTLANPSHIFTSGINNKTVKLKVTNPAGTDSSTQIITPNNPFGGFFSSRYEQANIDQYGSSGSFNIFYYAGYSTTVSATLVDGHHFKIPFQIVQSGGQNDTLRGSGVLVGSICSSRTLYISDTFGTGANSYMYIDTLTGH